VSPYLASNAWYTSFLPEGIQLSLNSFGQSTRLAPCRSYERPRTFSTLPCTSNSISESGPSSSPTSLIPSKDRRFHPPAYSNGALPPHGFGRTRFRAQMRRPVRIPLRRTLPVSGRRDRWELSCRQL